MEKVSREPLWGAIKKIDAALADIMDRLKQVEIAGAETKRGYTPEKPFCVIADTARFIHGGSQGRSWYATQPQAEAHAASIIRNNPKAYNSLYVVEIKSVVAVRAPELEVSRR